ncbi:MAG: type II secretion system F family protein [Clostridia bacterium]
MEQYRYTALNPAGKVKKGKMEASSVEDARLHLKDDLLQPIKINKMSVATRDIKTPWRKTVKAKQMARFLRQFSAIYQTGIPMIETLNLVRKQTDNKNLSTALYNVIQSVEKGESLYFAFKKEDTVFTNLLCEIIAVGEQSGALASVLDKLASYYEKIEEAKNATIKALIYPAIVLLLVAVVMTFMMSQVLPMFEKIFADAETELPTITRIVIACGTFVQTHYVFFLIMTVIIIGVLILFANTTKGKYFFSYILRKIPIISSFTNNQESAMFANTLSILLQAGIPILQALDICKGTLKNIYYSDAVSEVKDMIIKGHSLGLAVSSVDVFPLTLCQMVVIGESSGQLAKMLEKTAVYYDSESKVATERLLTALEPTIMILLCAFVSVIIFAIILPMFTVYGTML